MLHETKVRVQDKQTLLSHTVCNIINPVPLESPDIFLDKL